MNPTLQKRLKSLVNFQETPHRLALAFGIGVALGIIPGTGAVAAGVLAAFFKLNFPLMVAGALLTNPFTTPFVYLISYLIGHWLLGSWLPDGRIARLVLSIMTGGPVLALLMGIASYFFVRIFVKLVRAQDAACR